MLSDLILNIAASVSSGRPPPPAQGASGGRPIQHVVEDSSHVNKDKAETILVVKYSMIAVAVAVYSAAGHTLQHCVAS